MASVPNDIGRANDKEGAKLFKRPLKNKGEILDARAAFGSDIGEIGKMGSKGNEK